MGEGFPTICGIIGFTGHEIGPERLERGVRALRHRGPDGNGVYFNADTRVGLGHARLSIIDLTLGGQPLYSEDGSLVLVANGEIYDFERIRSELEACGHRFATHTDSEVILHLYEEYGLDFVHHLRGEFAFLLYDRNTQQLLAVRDRFGIKPLFFNVQAGRYLFASEAKAMFATGALAPRIDPAALRDCLSFVMPDSVFQGVEGVQPGCLLQVDLRSGTHALVRYWDLDLPDDVNPPLARELERDIRDVRAGVEEAIRLRLRADVPVGVYLSGGIDSAIVAATVARLHSEPLKVFTIAFPEDATFNEYQLAKNMAAKVGAEFLSVTCDHAALLDNTEGSLWAAELPFFNFHGVGKYMLSALARRHVKVVLTGEGSDELFLGYGVFQPGKRFMPGRTSGKGKARKPPAGKSAQRILDALGFIPAPGTVAMYSGRVQGWLQRFFHARHQKALAGAHPVDRMARRARREQTDGRPQVRRVQYTWIKAMLPNYILTMLGDRAEMAHSLEGRTPFLDHPLFERVRDIPDEHKIQGENEKYVLREAFKEDLTAEIYGRKKWPYTAPPLWIRKGHNARLDALIDANLSREAIEGAGLFNYNSVRLLRGLCAALFFDSQVKRGLNAFLVFVLTTQILDRLYVQEFDQSFERCPELMAQCNPD